MDWQDKRIHLYVYICHQYEALLHKCCRGKVRPFPARFKPLFLWDRTRVSRSSSCD